MVSSYTRVLTVLIGTPSVGGQPAHTYVTVQLHRRAPHQGRAAGLHGNYDMVDHQRRQASAHGVKIESLAAAATARPSSSSGQQPNHLPQASPPFVLWSKLSNGATCGVTTQQLHCTNNQCPLHRHNEEEGRREEARRGGGQEGRGQISRTMFYSQRHKVSDICLFIVAHHAAVVGGAGSVGRGKQGGKGEVVSPVH